MRAFKVEHISIEELRPNAQTARLHSNKQLHQIAASIKEFGFNNPVLVDREGIILAGHGRVEAAKLLGVKSVPIIRIEHLSNEQKRAFALADNKIALNAGWDLEMLALDLKELSNLELPFDLEITGFDTAEIELHIDGIDSNKADPCDLIPPAATAVSRVGELWVLGEHKLLCGDARDSAAYSALLEDERAR